MTFDDYAVVSSVLAVTAYIHLIEANFCRFAPFVLTFKFSRTSLLDTPRQLDDTALEENVRLIAESLLSYLYDVDASSCTSAKAGGAACSLLGSDSVRKERLRTWIDAFGSSPRPMAASSTKLVTELRDVVQKYAGRATLYEIQPYDLQLYGVLGECPLKGFSFSSRL